MLTFCLKLRAKSCNAYVLLKTTGEELQCLWNVDVVSLPKSFSASIVFLVSLYVTKIFGNAQIDWNTDFETHLRLFQFFEELRTFSEDNFFKALLFINCR